MSATCLIFGGFHHVRVIINPKNILLVSSKLLERILKTAQSKFKGVLQAWKLRNSLKNKIPCWKNLSWRTSAIWSWHVGTFSIFSLFFIYYSCILIEYPEILPKPWGYYFYILYNFHENLTKFWEVKTVYCAK